MALVSKGLRYVKFTKPCDKCSPRPNTEWQGAAKSTQRRKRHIRHQQYKTPFIEKKETDKNPVCPFKTLKQLQKTASSW